MSSSGSKNEIEKSLAEDSDADGSEDNDSDADAEEMYGANSDDDQDDDQSQPHDGSASSLNAIKSMGDDEFFMTYGKKSFYVSEDSIVLRGKPHEFENGKDMGKMLNSKSPDEWKMIKTKHITVLNDGTYDFLYVTAYVAGSEAKDIDIKRLHPVSKVVSKALVARFNNSSMSDERKQAVARLLNYKLPADEAGPQISPAVAGWKLAGGNVKKIPTAAIKPTTKPRAPAQKKLSNAEKRALDADFSYSRHEIAASAGEGVVAAELNEPLAAVVPTFSAAQVNSGAMGGSGVKRLRTLEVVDAARTHVFIGSNNKVFCIEY